MEQFNLNWHTYNDHLKEMMQHLMQSNESSDVTLVCEDRTKFKAHKFVLNACSPIFQSIINDLPQKDPVIYLRGIFAPEMKSILQFMYLGQATFYQDRMNEFLEVAKSLEIKVISKDEEYDVTDQQNNQQCDEKVEPVFENSLEETTVESPSRDKGEFKHINSRILSHRNEAGQYPCNKCDKLYTRKDNLDRHIQSAHEGIKYPCNNCEYQATTANHLKTHIRSIHKGIKFPCDLCDYKASQNSHLNNHKKNKH